MKKTKDKQIDQYINIKKEKESKRKKKQCILKFDVTEYKT